MARWWVRLMQVAAKGLGYSAQRVGPLTVVTRVDDISGPQSLDVSAWLARAMMYQVASEQAIDLVLDVGGNHGQFARGLRASGYQGRILTFEPQPESYQKLLDASRDDPDWRIEPLALGDVDGEVLLRVNASSLFTSIAPPSAEGLRLFGSALELVEEVTIPVRRLDGLSENEWIRAANAIFLKVDTQGHDAKVLLGGAAMLERCSMVLRELSLIPIYEGMELFEDSVAAMRRYGFLPAGFYAVSRAESLVMVEADGLFVQARESRKSALGAQASLP